MESADNTWPKFKRNVRLLSGAYALNCTIIFCISLALYLYLPEQKIENIIAKYKDDHISYFKSFTIESFKSFLQYEALITSLFEETLFRLPFLLMLRIADILRIRYKKITNIFLLTGSLVFNFYWTFGHTFFLPIFITGCTLYWLTLKTRSLWPAVACHFLFNITLYFIVQIGISYNMITPFK